MADSKVWYVAYAGNFCICCSQNKFVSNRNRTLHSADTAGQWTTINRQLYFATESGIQNPGSFLSINSDQSIKTPGRAFLVEAAEFVGLIHRENGFDATGWSFEDFNFAVDDWTALPIGLSEDQSQGRLNAIVRLPNIDGRPAYASTTSHLMTLKTPDQTYTTKMMKALQSLQAPSTAISQTGAALEAAHRELPFATNRRYLSVGTRKILVWSGEVSLGGDAAVPSVILPFERSGATRFESERMGRVIRPDGSALDTWLRYESGSSEVRVTTDVAAFLGITATSKRASARVETYLPSRPERLIGTLNDIPATDVIQVSQEAARKLGDWVFVMTPHVSGPFRVSGREHVPHGSMRLAYGARQLLGLQSDEAVWIVPIDPRGEDGVTQRGRTTRAICRTTQFLSALFLQVLERIWGAPTVAFRTTEGLLGDESKLVVRVDSTSLDYLGVSAGDVVFATWATRRVRVRVLLQTPETREWMDKRQLHGINTQSVISEVTEKQGQLDSPGHIKAWASARVRTELSIQPDSIIRLRRSVSHQLMKHLSRLSIPLAGTFIAFMAIPKMSAWALTVATSVIVWLTFIPVRVRD